MLANKLLMQQDEASGDVAEGVSFDGVTDYLSRSTDLVGNVDTKTFTFSCWVYVHDNGEIAPRVYSVKSDTTSEEVFRVFIYYNGTTFTRLSVSASTSAGTNIIYADVVSPEFKNNTFNHIVISVDVTNTSNRHIYLNDAATSVNWSVYANIALEFTNNLHYIAARAANITNYYLKGRLSHIFLDYTYRDLSIEANRRLFITADGKPADGLASLNPILYLPMLDKSTAHINEGTGGNFTQQGTLATADRGANQDNCVASEFDGVDDYLRSTDIGASDGKQFVLSFIANIQNSPFYVVHFYYRFEIVLYVDGTMIIRGKDTSITTVLELTNFSLKIFGAAGTQYHFSMSFDMTSSTLKSVFLNGKDITNTFTVNAYTNSAIAFNRASYDIASLDMAGLKNGSIGELYFDTNYIDLATNNPFWDSETNKPIPVRKAMESLGSNPLICMPIDASNPTKNYGSGGDFTLNGGGLVGARGASEYIARSAGNIDGGLNTARYLNATLSGITSGFSGFICVKRNTTSASTETLLALGGTSGFGLYTDTTEDLKMRLNGSTSTIYTDLFTNTDWHTIFFYKPNNTTNSYYFVVDGVQSTEVVLYSELNLSLQNYIMYDGVSSNKWNGYVANLYFTIDHIDFSQESNRNLFVNQLGYPRDLTPEIEAGNIPTPLIYLPFDDPDNLGKNLGTGGDFTVNGTVTAGADFSL